MTVVMHAFRWTSFSVVLCFSAGVSAAPVVQDVFSMRLQNSANANNFATGEIFFWGANVVQPAATSFGFTRQCPAGASCTSPTDPDFVRQSLFYRPFTIRPDQYFASRPHSANLTGPWTLLISSDPTFQPANTTIVNTQAVGSVPLMPFVPSMSAQGTGLTPTISWTVPTLPSGLTIDQVRISIFNEDRPVTTTTRNPFQTNPPFSFQQSDFIFTQALPGAATSFQIPASAGLQFGTRYSIGINLDHLQNPGNPLSVDSRSQSFFEFTPINLPGLNVFLPTTVPVPTTSGLTAGPLYSFQIDGVSPDQVTFIDPFVATGFVYTKGDGDPNFKSVQIATDVGDGLYDVLVWDGTQYLLVKTGLGVNEIFEFALGGVEQFKVAGIETSAEVSPFDLTAFVTGLTFVADGRFTGTMQAIAVEVAAVPEPGTLALLAASVFAFAAMRRRAMQISLRRRAV